MTGAGQPPLEIEAVLGLVLTSAARLFQGEGGSIMLRVGEDELEVVASPTNPAALGAKVRFGEGVSGKVAATCEPVLVTGRVNQRTNAVDSSVCLPLVHAGELFGVLNINARPVHTFTNHDLGAGTDFCGHAADALVAARSYELARMRGEPEPELHLEQMQRHFLAAASVDFVGPLARDLVDVAAIVRSVAGSEDQARRATSFRGGLGATVVGEGKQVRRLVQELVDNAHRHGKRPVRLRVESPDDEVVITVSDHGEGVPVGERERMFAPFARLADDAEGLGVGLTIARRIAGAMGGSVTFADPTEPDEHSAVTARFPRAT